MNHYVILPQLYEPALLEEIMRRVDSAPFLPKDHDGVGNELCMDDRVTETMMTFFPNNPAFLRLLERITGEPRLGEFVGRVYRMTSSDGHYDGWHDDCCGQACRDDERKFVSPSVRRRRPADETSRLGRDHARDS